MAVLGVLMAGTLGILEQGQRAYATGATRVEAQQNARVALTRLAAEIRGAGRGGRGFDAISVAAPQRLKLHQDLNGDDLLTLSAETVTWRLGDTTLRRSAAGGAQPVLYGVEHFALTYFDGAGAVTTSPAAVRSVGITLSARSQRAGPAATFVIATRVRIRNR